MEGFKYTTIGHSGQKLCNPISEAKYERLLSLLPLTGKDRVIDIGAGKCETLIRLIERYGVEATGIDLNPSFTAEAARLAEGRADQSRLHIVLGDAAETLSGLAPGFALGICVGSTHALGGFEPTLTALKRLLRPGGHILVGDCYWKKRPSPEYLAALGDDESVFLDLAGNVNLLIRNGLTPLWTAVASEDDWDQYESLHTMSIEQYCTDNPDDPHCNALLGRARSWRDLYYQWGRDTLGFSLHLARLA
jgi:SAM-dependent methyltransferase